MGLALLARKGLAVWLDAWASGPAPSAAGLEPASRALPAPVRQELVLALARLVLGRRAEVSHG
jgi:hypothetical protein